MTAVSLPGLLIERFIFGFHFQYLKHTQGLELPSFDDLVKSKSDPDLSDVRRTILEAGHYSEHIARWMKYYNAKQVSPVIPV